MYKLSAIVPFSTVAALDSEVARSVDGSLLLITFLIRHSNYSYNTPATICTFDRFAS